MVAANIAKNKDRHIPNRSCGRTPTDHANAGIPVVAFAGSWKMKFGAVLSINIGEEALLNWSAKLEGGS